MHISHLGDGRLKKLYFSLVSIVTIILIYYGSKDWGISLSLPLPSGRSESFLRGHQPSPGVTLTPPGVVVDFNANGGLGNQLFKLACSYAVARGLGVPLFLPVPDDPGTESNLDTMRDPSKRQFGLDAFTLTLTPGDVEVYKISQKKWKSFRDSWTWTPPIINFSCSDIYYERVPHDEGKKAMLLYTKDYCHSEKYFERFVPEVKRMLTFAPTFLESISGQSFLKWKRQIQNASKEMSTSAAIHIRRGDFTSFSEEIRTTPISYFEKAISTMVEKFCEKRISFFVFSDDIDFVKTALSTLYKPLNKGKLCTNVPEFYYVSKKLEDGNYELTNLEEFLLMTLCKNMIISNSSFSWWAAYLMKDDGQKTIIGPTFHPDYYKNMRDGAERAFSTFMLQRFKYPKDWIILDPYNGKGM